MGEIQAVIFKDNVYNTLKSRTWLKNHNLKPIKRVHHTDNYFRYRIREPEQFKRFITKSIDYGKIKLIIGYKE